MVKLLLNIFLSALLMLGLSSGAQCQGDPEFYEEYDNYEEFEKSYVDNYVVDKVDPQDKLFARLSVPALLIGAAIGSGVAVLLLRRFSLPPEAQPHFRQPKQEHETVEQTEILIGSESGF